MHRERQKPAANGEVYITSGGESMVERHGEVAVVMAHCEALTVW